MKVLLANNLFGENARGGAERIVEKEARALIAAGHDVVVASLSTTVIPESRSDVRDPENQKNIVVEKTVRETHIPSTNLFHYLDLDAHGLVARFAWHLVDMVGPRAVPAFERVLDAERPDVVHTHNLMGLGFLLPALLRRRKIRHVHTVHDVQLLHPSGLLASGELRLHARAYAAIMRWLMGSPDVVVFPSSYLRSLHDARGFFPRSRTVVLPNPAPASRPDPRPWPGPRFVFAGQLERHKGIFTLLEAWKKADVPEGTLRIFGGGASEEEARIAGALRGVEFFGRVDGDALVDEFARAAFTVVPSLVIENAPSTIMESFAAGTPVIASAVGGIPETVQEAKTGFLVPMGDVDALAAALRKALPDLVWVEMSSRCRTLAAERGIAAHVAALVDLYAGK